MFERNHAEQRDPRSRTLTVGVALVLAVAMFGIASPAPADANGPVVVVVDDDGFGTAADCNASSPAVHTNIQAGVDAAFGGDTVFVCPGLYLQTTTPGITVGKALTITSGGAAGVVVSGNTKNA